VRLRKVLIDGVGIPRVLLESRVSRRVTGHPDHDEPWADPWKATYSLLGVRRGTGHPDSVRKPGCHRRGRTVRHVAGSSGFGFDRWVIETRDLHAAATRGPET